MSLPYAAMWHGCGKVRRLLSGNQALNASIIQECLAHKLRERKTKFHFFDTSTAATDRIHGHRESSI